VDYLRFGFTDHLDRSMFTDVRPVRPGTCVEIDVDEPSRRRASAYWKPEPRPLLDVTFDVAADRLRALLLESIDLHLRSDVPVACCLSGGIDSSSIALMMRHVGGSKAEIHTFSHVWPGKPFDEADWVDTVNAACGAVAHKIESTPEDLAHDLTVLVEQQQIPFSTTSVYAQYRVMGALHRSGLKVTLDGQGADELFGGYGFHIGARMGSLVKQGRFGTAYRLMREAKNVPDVSTWTNVQNMFDYLLPARMQRAARSLGGRSLIPDWIDADWCERHRVAPDPYRTASSRELLREAVCRSLAGPGLPHLLRYEDQNSMAFSVETRVPFLSQPVIDFALALPEAFLVDDRAETKTLLRKAMRGIVPDAVLDRKDKVAFQTPELEWLRAMGDSVGAALTSDAARRVRGLDVDSALAHWERVKVSGDESALPVWRWINLIEWTRVFDVTYPD
jgi:asparagine synthase (glutamine-hydrolysing)